MNTDSTDSEFKLQGDASSQTKSRDACRILETPCEPEVVANVSSVYLVVSKTPLYMMVVNSDRIGTRVLLMTSLASQYSRHKAINR